MPTIMLLNPHRTFLPENLFDIISRDRESDNLFSVVSNAIYRLRSSLDIVGLKKRNKSEKVCTAN